MKNKIESIVNNITEITDHSNKNTLIIGVSGGIDSCLTLTIIHKFLPNYKILPYYLPIENNNDYPLIKKIERFLNLKIELYDFSSLWKQCVNDFEITNKMNAYNIKSKLRNMFLYSKAFENNGLVISNLNYDEYYLGYFTKFGDSNGDLYPLINFTKQDIINMAKYLQIPMEIINQKPSAGLYINQFDEDEFKFTYTDLDKYLNHIEINNDIERLIQKRANENKHKKTLNHLINNNYRKE